MALNQAVNAVKAELVLKSTSSLTTTNGQGRSSATDDAFGLNVDEIEVLLRVIDTFDKQYLTELRDKQKNTTCSTIPVEMSSTHMALANEVQSPPNSRLQDVLNEGTYVDVDKDLLFEGYLIRDVGAAEHDRGTYGTDNKGLKQATSHADSVEYTADAQQDFNVYDKQRSISRAEDLELLEQQIYFSEESLASPESDGSECAEEHRSSGEQSTIDSEDYDSYALENDEPHPHLQMYQNIYVYRVDNFEDFYVLGPILGEGAEGLVRECAPIHKCLPKDGDLDDEGWRKLCKLEYCPPEHIYAVKVTQLSLRNTDSEVHDMAHFLGTMRHENVLKYMALYEDDFNYFFLMEKVDGLELMDCLTAVQEVPPPAVSQNLFRQIMLSLDFVHSQNLIHRDVKPDNFVCEIPDTKQLFGSFGSSTALSIADSPAASHTGSSLWDAMETCRLLLIDFGLACHIDDAWRFAPDGTTMYMAPELLLCGALPYTYDQKTDMWSAGIILCMLLTGEPPFGSGGVLPHLQKVLSSKMSMEALPIHGSDFGSFLCAGNVLMDQEALATAPTTCPVHKDWDEPVLGCAYCERYKIQSAPQSRGMTYAEEMTMEEGIQRLIAEAARRGNLSPTRAGGDNGRARPLANDEHEGSASSRAVDKDGAASPMRSRYAMMSPLRLHRESAVDIHRLLEVEPIACSWMGSDGSVSPTKGHRESPHTASPQRLSFGGTESHVASLRPPIGKLPGDISNSPERTSLEELSKLHSPTGEIDLYSITECDSVASTPKENNSKEQLNIYGFPKGVTSTSATPTTAATNATPSTLTFATPTTDFGNGTTAASATTVAAETATSYNVCLPANTQSPYTADERLTKLHGTEERTGELLQHPRFPAFFPPKDLKNNYFRDSRNSAQSSSPPCDASSHNRDRQPHLSPLTKTSIHSHLDNHSASPPPMGEEFSLGECGDVDVPLGVPHLSPGSPCPLHCCKCGVTVVDLRGKASLLASSKSPEFFPQLTVGDGISPSPTSRTRRPTHDCSTSNRMAARRSHVGLPKLLVSPVHKGIRSQSTASLWSDVRRTLVRADDKHLSHGRLEKEERKSTTAVLEFEGGPGPGEESPDPILRMYYRLTVKMNGEAWGSVSKSGKQLVRRLLSVDPRQRPGAAEVLEDPWFKDNSTHTIA